MTMMQTLVHKVVVNWSCAVSNVGFTLPIECYHILLVLPEHANQIQINKLNWLSPFSTHACLFLGGGQLLKVWYKKLLFWQNRYTTLIRVVPTSSLTTFAPILGILGVIKKRHKKLSSLTVLHCSRKQVAASQSSGPWEIVIAGFWA